MRSSSTDAVFSRAVGVGPLRETIYVPFEQVWKDRDSDWRTDYLAWLIEREPELEFLEVASSRRFRFRYRPHGFFNLCEKEVDNLNAEISDKVRKLGRTCLSKTDLHGRVVLQASLTDHENQSAMLNRLIRDVLHLARQILGRFMGASLG